MFGAFMVAGGLMAIMIPETNNVPLPECVEEANKMKWNWDNRYALVSTFPLY